VATHRERFTKGSWRESAQRLTHTERTRLQPLRGALPVRPEPASLVGGGPRSVRPPEAVRNRAVVVKRTPPQPKLPWRAEAAPRPGPQAVPERRFVTVPSRAATQPSRPEFGGETGVERMPPPPPPRFEERRREPPATVPPPATRERERAEPSLAEPRVPRGAEQEDRQRAPQPVQPAPMTRERERVETPPQAPRAVTPAPAQPRSVEPQQRQRAPAEPRRAETPASAPQAAPQAGRPPERTELPGKPANRVYRAPGRDREEGDQRRSQERR
jgi:hypothetical protein